MKSPSRFLSFAAVCLLSLATGCAGNPGSPSSSGSTPALYVIQNNSNAFTGSILEFPANAKGSVTPAATINGPASTYFYAVAVDQSGNVYAGAETEVVNPNAVFEIFEYAAGSTGAATPIRTINSVAGISSLAVDSTGQIYAVTQDGIEVFAANATGNATPIRQIPANSTTTLLGTPFAIAVDSAQNIYVADATNILVFSPTANGNVAPARAITWPTPQLGIAESIAVDAKGDIFATVTSSCIVAGCTFSSSILEFAPGANGAATPTNVLTIQPNPSFPNSQSSADGVAVDGAGNLYAQVNTITFLGLGDPVIQNAISLEMFTPGQTGSIAPAQTVTSTAWTDADSFGLALH